MCGKCGYGVAAAMVVTRTLTYRIARQLSELKSDKNWVVAITYTHCAADGASQCVFRGISCSCREAS